MHPRPYQSQSPRKVQHAVTMLYASLGIAAVQAFIKSTSPAGPFGAGTSNEWESVLSAVIILVTLIFLVMLFSGIAQGLSWSRLIFLVLFAFGVPTLPAIVADSFRVSTLSGIFSVMQAILQASALLLLYHRTTNAWFRQQSDMASASLKNEGISP